MVRAFWTRSGVCASVLLSALAAGCQHHTGESTCAEPLKPAATAPAEQFTLSGGVVNPGTRKLEAGETVSKVIMQVLPVPPGAPMTIVLIRQAPEGKTRQLIQLGSDGKLMDPKQDWALRNGDEIVFPGGRGGDTSTNPTGH